MFTGLVSDLGRVRRIVPPPEGAAGDLRLTIATSYDMGTVAHGASIACSGVCLTVVDKGADWFAVDVSAETLSRSTLGRWGAGTTVNLERSLRLGDELGGHFVFGHVDAVATVADRWQEGGSWRVDIAVPATVMPFLAPKGSVALDGVSLTVNEVADGHFGVNVIPHTFAATTLGAAGPGTALNLEIDMLARYVARQLEAQWPARTP